jgi:peptidoglycan hydrolase CwlO-like protein
VDEVRKQVEKLYEEADRAQDRLARKQQEINELRRTIGLLAAAQYRTGGIDPSVQLFLSSAPEEYLHQAQTLHRASDRQAEALAALQNKQRQLTQEREAVAKRLTAIGETRAEAANRKGDQNGPARK